jgi:hypothetical protein
MSKARFVPDDERGQVSSYRAVFIRAIARLEPRVFASLDEKVATAFEATLGRGPRWRAQMALLSRLPVPDGPDPDQRFAETLRAWRDKWNLETVGDDWVADVAIANLEAWRQHTKYRGRLVSAGAHAGWAPQAPLPPVYEPDAESRDEYMRSVFAYVEQTEALYGVAGWRRAPALSTSPRSLTALCAT